MNNSPQVTLVLGGTGRIGSLVASKLAQRGLSTRTASRHGADAPFDWDNPATTSPIATPTPGPSRQRTRERPARLRRARPVLPDHRAGAERARRRRRLLRHTGRGRRFRVRHLRPRIPPARQWSSSNTRSTAGRSAPGTPTTTTSSPSSRSKTARSHTGATTSTPSPYSTPSAGPPTTSDNGRSRPSHPDHRVRTARWPRSHSSM